MKFSELAAYLNRFEALSSRNDMVVLLGELFNKLGGSAKKDGQEISRAVYLMSGRVAPQFIAIEFGFSLKLILRSLSELTGTGLEELTTAYKKVGDIGEFTFQLVLSNKGKGNDIDTVFEQLKVIAETSGKNSQTIKQKLFLDLIAAATPEEAKYLVRILVGNMRMGLSTKTMLDGLSWALSGGKSLRPVIEHAYGVSVDFGLIAQVALTKGTGSLKKMHVIPGIPVATKLVEREKTAAAIIERMGSCYIQPKFDGLRVQIHYQKNGFPDSGNVKKSELSLLDGGFGETPNNKVRIFSRNMEDLTGMLPDVAAAIAGSGVESVVLDGEAIGFDIESGNFLPFQETIKRKRKYNITEMTHSHPLEVNVFDVLELNGQDLLHEPFEKRFGIVKELLAKAKIPMLKFTKTDLVTTPEELEQLFQGYVKHGLEGIIAKVPDSTYDPGTRNFDWIKLKASASSELVDTIDAVVLGYYRGEGQRTKFGIGALLIGLYDDEQDAYISLAKVGTGIKDKDWPVIISTLEPLRVDKLPAHVVVNKNLIPDVIVKPQIVVVVEADSISLSKIHGEQAGGVLGMSLRFPRLKVFNRDKAPQDATTIKELQRLYHLQSRT